MSQSVERRGLVSRLGERINHLLEVGFEVITYAQQLRERRGIWGVVKAAGIPVLSLSIGGVLVVDAYTGNHLPIKSYDFLYIALGMTAAWIIHQARYPNWPSVFNLNRR